jgi:hypothetical protein
MSANQHQVGGDHYRSEYQHWDFVSDCLNSRYFEGQVTKYISRHHKKNGRQDVEKALHYATKMRELLLDGKLQPMFGGLVNWKAYDFCRINDLGPLGQDIVIGICRWQTVYDLNRVIMFIGELLAGYDTAIMPEEPTAGYVNQS